MVLLILILIIKLILLLIIIILTPTLILIITAIILLMTILLPHRMDPLSSLCQFLHSQSQSNQGVEEAASYTALQITHNQLGSPRLSTLPTWPIESTMNSLLVNRITRSQLLNYHIPDASRMYIGVHS